MLLGDVRQREEMRKRARDRQRLVNRHPLEDACQRLERRIVPSAGALRQRAYPLDGFVQGMILLPPQRFAQQLAKQPHIVAQRFREIVGHGGSVLRREAGFGAGRWALGEMPHRCPERLGNCPAAGAKPRFASAHAQRPRH